MMSFRQKPEGNVNVAEFAKMERDKQGIIFGEEQRYLKLLKHQIQELYDVSFVLAKSLPMQGFPKVRWLGVAPDGLLLTTGSMGNGKMLIQRWKLEGNVLFIHLTR